MACGVSNSSSKVVWFKNGVEVRNTTKTEITSGNLNIFCLEPSDSGEYVCKDKNTSANIDSHYLDVKNPGMHFDTSIYLTIKLLIRNFYLTNSHRSRGDYR